MDPLSSIMYGSSHCNPHGSFHFDRLPHDVIRTITDYLSSKDICHLRQCSKRFMLKLNEIDFTEKFCRELMLDPQPYQDSWKERFRIEKNIMHGIALVEEFDPINDNTILSRVVKRSIEILKGVPYELVELQRIFNENSYHYIRNIRTNHVEEHQNLWASTPDVKIVKFDTHFSCYNPETKDWEIIIPNNPEFVQSRDTIIKIHNNEILFFKTDKLVIWDTSTKRVVFQHILNSGKKIICPTFNSNFICWIYQENTYLYLLFIINRNDPDKVIKPLGFLGTENSTNHLKSWDFIFDDLIENKDYLLFVRHDKCFVKKFNKNNPKLDIEYKFEFKIPKFKFRTLFENFLIIASDCTITIFNLNKKNQSFTYQIKDCKGFEISRLAMNREFLIVELTSTNFSLRNPTRRMKIFNFTKGFRKTL